MIPALVRFADPPGITILGWTPSADQWSTATAVAAGVLGALLVILLWRKARKAILVGVVGLALLILWIRYGR